MGCWGVRLADDGLKCQRDHYRQTQGPHLPDFTLLGSCGHLVAPGKEEERLAVSGRGLSPSNRKPQRLML